MSVLSLYRGERVRWTDRTGGIERVRTGTVVRGPRRIGEDGYDLDADVQPDDAPAGQTVMLRSYHVDAVIG